MISRSTNLNTLHGEFKFNYHEFACGEVVVSLIKGDITKGNVLLRIHSSCIFGESFFATDCDCSAQLFEAMKEINKEGKGVIVYLFQEGRGIGLKNKVEAINLQYSKGIDTVEAFEHLEFPLDNRSYKYAIDSLKDLSISKKLRLMTNNPRKRNALENAGFKIVEEKKLSYSVSLEAYNYLKTKNEKLSHNIDFDMLKINLEQ